MLICDGARAILAAIADEGIANALATVAFDCPGNHGYRIYRQHSPFIYGSILSDDSGEHEFATQYCTLASTAAVVFTVYAGPPGSHYSVQANQKDSLVSSGPWESQSSADQRGHD